MRSAEYGKAFRFFADCMLGRLARWLRVLGHDTAYEHAVDDETILQTCLRENRVLLTRDNELARRCRVINCLFIESEKTLEQLRQVLNKFQLEIIEENFYRRCTYCNSEVVDIPRKEVEGRVPPYVFKTEKRFTWCPNCDKIFWRGTHRHRFLNHIFPEGRS